jgi:hypothetical protein
MIIKNKNNSNSALEISHGKRCRVRRKEIQLVGC